MSIKIDLKDKKLLKELDLNCRQSNQQIARKIGLSKDAVAYRITKLEQNKIITNYRTIINFQILGFTQYRVLLQLININEKTEQELIKTLKQEKLVWGIGLNEGEWDLAFTCLTKSNIEFHKFNERLKSKFRHNIKEEHISEIIKYQEFPRTYLTNEKRKIQEKIIFNKETKTIDETDHQILELLANNARIKLINIASKLKLSSMLIHQRIKKLEEKQIITGYKANLQVIELGRDYYGLKLNLNNYSEKEKIITEIQKMPEMTAILWTIGGYDIEFDLEVKDTKEYQQITNKLRNKFESIQEIKFIRAKEYFKLNHMPK